MKRYGSLAVRTLRAVLAADGSLDAEEYRAVAAVIAALGLPEADANALRSEPAIAAEALDAGEIDHAIARAIVRGAWLAAVSDENRPARRERDPRRRTQDGCRTGRHRGREARRGGLRRLAAEGGGGGRGRRALRALGPDAREPGISCGACRGSCSRDGGGTRRSRGGAGAPVTLAKRHVGLEADDRARSSASRGPRRWPKPERRPARGALRPVGAARRGPRGGRSAAARGRRALAHEALAGVARTLQ